MSLAGTVMQMIKKIKKKSHIKAHCQRTAANTGLLVSPSLHNNF